MKTWKGVVAGFAAGILCTGAVAVGASTTVQTYLMDNARIFVDGELQAIPDGQSILNYNSRIYVPIRFVSECLGADVNWDAANNYCMITSNPEVVEKVVEKEVEKIVYVDKDEVDSDTKVYQKLPITFETSEYKISITGISRRTNDNTTKVFITVENDEDNRNNIQLIGWEAKLVADGENYAYSGYEKQDADFDNSLQAGEEIEGYLLFDLVPEDYKNCELTITLREDTSNTNSDITKTFYFRVNN